MLKEEISTKQNEIAELEQRFKTTKNMELFKEIEQLKKDLRGGKNEWKFLNYKIEKNYIQIKFS